MNSAEQERQWEDRRQAIISHYRDSNSLTVTGLAFGISRQRVHQIVTEAREQAGKAAAAWISSGRSAAV